MSRVETTPDLHLRRGGVRTQNYEKPKMEAPSSGFHKNPCPSPSPHLHFSSSIFQDISNFKTPKHIPSATSGGLFHGEKTPQFFTASREPPTPSSSATTARRRRVSIAPSASKSKAIRRLRAFELEQSQSARKELLKKEKSMKSLAKSLTVWLNFLFENPDLCGCSGLVGRPSAELENKGVSGTRKRDSSEGGNNVAFDGAWRLPKRHKERSRGNLGDEDGAASKILSSKFSALKNSLKEVCSFDDMKERMRGYVSLASCKEVFEVMTLVTKNIDEGRLRMKAHCPIVTDVGMREKAIRVLLSYNPFWLRIGLYMIFGGESLLTREDRDTEQEAGFLKMVVEKQLFSHAGFAKAYAYNKLVEGVYRPGYFEALGNIMLKRFLLLVLLLDRAKSQSSLPLKYGLDGLDGGSPLLFLVPSSIKSSRQVVTDFLSSDAMHGEGNLLAHLVILGYKLSYQQLPLVEYEFRVSDLFQDIQDGVRLSRAIQLLQNDSSILMKVVLPHDSYKKRLSNCGIALQHLKQKGIPLYDDDGVEITAEDIASGEKELTLSLLWNMFIYLQLPLLVTKAALSEEISNICKAPVELPICDTSTHLDMLLSWIKAICDNYDYKMETFTSLVDGRAMWCLLDFYFRKDLHCSCSQKDKAEAKTEESVVSRRDNMDAVHNFVLSQKLSTLLGNFPEVLQVSDILEYKSACNDRSVIILLVFLSSQLLVKKSKDQLNFHKLMGCHCLAADRKHSSMDRHTRIPEGVLNNDEENQQSAEDAIRNFKVLKAWWQDMAIRNDNGLAKPLSLAFVPQSTTESSCASCGDHKERAAVVIQSYVRQSIIHRGYVKTKNAVSLLQSYIRAWLFVKHMSNSSENQAAEDGNLPKERQKRLEYLRRCIVFMAERHHFVKLKRSVLLIQRTVRFWICRKHQKKSFVIEDWFGDAQAGYSFSRNHVDNSLVACKGKEKDYHQVGAVVRIQLAWKRFAVCNARRKFSAATRIQSYFRGWILRRSFMNKREATIRIQHYLRYLRYKRELQQYRIQTRSATIIQSHVRGWLTRRVSRRKRDFIVLIQKHYRGRLARRDFLSQKEAARMIQRVIRIQKDCKDIQAFQHAVIEIQRYIRGNITRNRLLGASGQHVVSERKRNLRSNRDGLQCAQLKAVLNAIVKVQRWWRNVLLHKSRTQASVVIQRHARGLIDRRKVARERNRIVKIQEHYRGRLARRDFLSQKVAARMIQRVIRNQKGCQDIQAYQHAVIEIQRFIRGNITRNRLLGASCQHTVAERKRILRSSRDGLQCAQLKAVLNAIVKIQRWWKNVLLHKSRTQASVAIQRHARGLIDRRKVARERNRIVKIQSYWKGYLARKDGELVDLRHRVQKSAANVDDGMRLINRHLAALNELLNTRSLSNILRNLATLDKATGLSQRCCEILVNAGAIKILLTQIRSVSRSIPDQQILQHALSILRNLARYPHLAVALINRQKSVETILLELLRNKEDGFFIASDLLKKICRNQEGIETMRGSVSMLKRLHALGEDLARKAATEKRNNRGLNARQNITERRLKEVVELLNLITRK